MIPTIRHSGKGKIMEMVKRSVVPERLKGKTERWRGLGIFRAVRLLSLTKDGNSIPLEWPLEAWEKQEPTQVTQKCQIAMADMKERIKISQK